MKLKIQNNTIPGDFIGRIPKLSQIEYFGAEVSEYEVSDDFIRDLKFYLAGHEQDNYTSILIRLIFKADNINIFKLSDAYPAECLTISLYKNCPEFYKQLQ
jgi:hypothetical protein